MHETKHKLFEKTIYMNQDLTLKFNDNIFDIDDLRRYFATKDATDFIEFLPGIYYKEVVHQLPLLYRIIDKITNSTILPISTHYELCNLVNAHTQITISIEISNFRDDIELYYLDELVYKTEFLYEDAKQISAYLKKGSSFTTVFKQVETKDILYPFSPGGAGERCRIMGLFYKLKLIERIDGYSFFTKHEMFYASANFDDLLNECKKFDHCMNTLKTMELGTYVWPSPEDRRDNLRMSECNNVYKISNANHRICCAKRFNLPSVISEVYVYDVDESPEPTPPVYAPRKPHFQNDNTNELILKDFYSITSNLGLNSEQSHHILENALRGTELIAYLYEITGKTLYQLSKD